MCVCAGVRQQSITQTIFKKAHKNLGRVRKPVIRGGGGGETWTSLEEGERGGRNDTSCCQEPSKANHCFPRCNAAESKPCPLPRFLQDDEDVVFMKPPPMVQCLCVYLLIICQLESLLCRLSLRRPNEPFIMSQAFFSPHSHYLASMIPPPSSPRGKKPLDIYSLRPSVRPPSAPQKPDKNPWIKLWLITVILIVQCFAFESLLLTSASAADVVVVSSKRRMVQNFLMTPGSSQSGSQPRPLSLSFFARARQMLLRALCTHTHEGS